MPGHESSRVIAADRIQLEELSCGICHNILNHPLATQCCRQTYCKDCIEEWLRGHNTCPIDRKRLTRGQLSEVPRLVVNLIDSLRMSCVFSGKGCPSVHTISEDSVHALKCEFNECTECGHRGDKTGHNWIKYLLHKVDKLKAENCFITAVNSAYRAINNCSVEVNHNFDKEWEEELIDICEEVIDGFDDSTQTIQDFIATIEDKIKELPNELLGLYHWNVSLSPNDKQGQSGDTSKLLQLAFGKLKIVITVDYHGHSE